MSRFDDLTYTPLHGSVTLRGERSEWAVDVPTNVGRAMEEDGIEVLWIHSTVPEWAVRLGLTSVYSTAQRVFHTPSRLLK